MENFGLLFGGVGLLLCLGGLACRFYTYNFKIDRPSPIFTLYSAASLLLAAVTIAIGFISVPSPWDIFFVLWLLSWNGVSVLATFTAPARMAAFPVSYIILCTSFFLYSFCNDTPDQSRPFIPTIALGTILLVSAILALVLSLKKRPRTTSDI
jgi:hypothetical protein